MGKTKTNPTTNRLQSSNLQLATWKLKNNLFKTCLPVFSVSTNNEKTPIDILQSQNSQQSFLIPCPCPSPSQSPCRVFLSQTFKHVFQISMIVTGSMNFNFMKNHCIDDKSGVANMFKRFNYWCSWK